jgi:integrase
LGVPDKTIQAILRHSSVAVTQNCYIKTVDGAAVQAMRILENVWDENEAVGEEILN